MITEFYNKKDMCINSFASCCVPSPIPRDKMQTALASYGGFLT